MVRLLNKRAFLFAYLLLLSLCYFSQEERARFNEKDYKDPEQFEKFYKKRKYVATWQIHELKNGALVVKLKTDKILIEALSKQGKNILAEQKRLEAYIKNKNLMRAYSDHYKFSKVYFIYSNYHDSLLNGSRSNLFLDTNLVIDPQITMTENFYLIAETDNIYNSSIGFLPEDSARFEIERGDPTRTNVPIVLKNKFGHQLKRPFPFTESAGQFLTIKEPKFYIAFNGIPIPYYVVRNSSKKITEQYIYEGQPITIRVPKMFTYKWLSAAVENLNSSLDNFYRESPKPDASKLALMKPFLY